MGVEVGDVSMPRSYREWKGTVSRQRHENKCDLCSRLCIHAKGYNGSNTDYDVNVHANPDSDGNGSVG